MEPNRATPTKRIILPLCLDGALGALHIVRRVINYSFSSKSVTGGLESTRKRNLQIAFIILYIYVLL